MSKQLTLFVTFKIKPDRVEDFLAAHRPVWAACAKEPECLLFDVFRDPQSPGTFRFIEVWSKDRHWFETQQMTKPYYTELWRLSKPTWEEEPKLEYYDRTGEGCIFRQAYLDGGVKME